MNAKRQAAIEAYNRNLKQALAGHRPNKIAAPRKRDLR